MAAIITDLLDRVSDSNTGRPIIATLAAPGKAIGASSLNLAAATNWTTTTAIHFTIYNTVTVGSTVVKDPTSQTDWKGTLAGTTISGLTITGGTDRAYTAGAIVELAPTSRYAKDLYDWGIAAHNQDGTHKVFTESNIVPTAAIQDNAITAAKIPAASITNAKLATGATRLGISKLSGTSTLIATTFTTYLTVTATSTGRECEADFRVFVSNGNSGSDRVAYAKIQCDGVDVAPATMEQYIPNVTGSGPNYCMSFVVSSTPTAGSHTWTLQLRATAASAVGLTHGVLKVSEIA